MNPTSAPSRFLRASARLGASISIGLALSLAGATAMAATGPVPVAVVAETPVNVFMPIVSGATSSFGNNLYTVPAGKQLIVDSASLATSTTSASPQVSALVLNREPNGTTDSFVTVVAPPGAPALGTQPVRLQLPAGNQLVANVFAASGSISVYISVSGHLVDAP